MARQVDGIFRRVGVGERGQGDEIGIKTDSDFFVLQRS